MLPDLSTLLTTYLQEKEIQSLHEQVVIAHKLLEDECKRIRKLMTTFITIRGFASNSLQMESNCLYSNSLAEQTLEENYTTRTDKPLVAGTDRKMYPKNPSNGYISRFPDDLTGCLGCGLTEHRFRGCPRSNEKDLRDFFWQELWAHIPTTRKKPSPPFTTTNRFISSPSIPSNPPLPPSPRHSASTPRSNSNSITWQEHQDAKRPRFLLYLLAFLTFRLLNRNRCQFLSITLYLPLAFYSA